jgi:dTDP-4-amino-4,6-dideoxygalactose transaminase
LPYLDTRTKLIEYLKSQNILSVFHYLSLHKSPFFNSNYSGRHLMISDNYSDTLLRLPLFFDLNNEDLLYIIESLYDCFKSK